MTESRDYFPLSVNFLVGVKGLEPPASCSQSRRATNCATPGYFVILSGWSYSPKPPARQRETRLPRREEAASHDNSPTTAPILYITRLPRASIS